MRKSVLLHMHIMWYEVDMVYETLDSIVQAMSYNKDCDIFLKFCLNHQTYLENPEDVDIASLFTQLKTHPIFQHTNVEIVDKTNSDVFYNIGDWRRENYGTEYDYYVWGESDCLVPESFFYNLSLLAYDTPHVISYAQRKMWDNSWIPVEHVLLQGISCDSDLNLIAPLGQGYISLEELNSFNRTFSPIFIELPFTKIDGNMTTLSKGIPTPILPQDLHFIHEDLALQIWLQANNIPQVHCTNQIKGHNFQHPKKRRYTKTPQGEELYTKYKQQSAKCIEDLVNRTKNS